MAEPADLSADQPVVSVPLLDEMGAFASLAQETAAWVATERPPAMWHPEDVSQERLLASYRPEEFRWVHLGDHPLPVAAFVLQEEDRLFWPDAAEGEALYLHKVVVARSHAGRGLGAWIMDHACVEARQAGRPYVRLDTPVDRPALRATYERSGFELVGTRVVGLLLGDVEVALYQRPA